MKQSYEDRLLIPIEGSTLKLTTGSGLLICDGYCRVVIGGRGPYIEMRPDQVIKKNIEVPTSERWRFEHDRYHDICYHEWRSKDIFNVKLYEQTGTVEYADYKVGMWYVSPFDVRIQCGKARCIEPIKSVAFPNSLFE